MKDLEDLKSKKYGVSNETEIPQSEFKCLQSLEKFLGESNNS